MKRFSRWPVWTLTFLFLALHATHYISIAAMPWLHSLAPFAPLPLALLLVLQLARSESIAEELQGLEHDARTAGQSLADDLSRLSRLQEQLQTLKQQVDSHTESIRSTDSLLHAKLLFYQGKYEDAAELFKETLKAEPHDPQRNYWCGNALLRAGEAEASLHYLGRAAKGAASDPRIVEAYGDALAICGSFRDAVAQFQAALSLQPTNRELVTRKLGRAQLRFDAASGELTLKSLLHDNPANLPVIVPLARAMLDQKRFDDAIAVCDRALKAVPTLKNVLPLRAEALLMRNGPGDERLAEMDLTQAESVPTIAFHVNRVRGEWLVLTALENGDPAKQRALWFRAREQFELGVHRSTKNLKMQTQLRANLAQVLLLLGNREEALEQALQAKSPTSTFHVLTLLECLFATNKWITLAAEASAIPDQNPYLYLWSRLHLLLAKVFSGEGRAGLRRDLEQLEQLIRDAPNFDPRTRPLWRIIRGAAPATSLPPSQRDLAEAILNYIESARSDLLLPRIQATA